MWTLRAEPTWCTPARRPKDRDFAVRPGLPEQPYSIRPDTYQLFLGNETYLLAWSAHCDPAAVWPVNQH
ncbi:hypothetical protein RKD49_007838 [Streptomyces glaucescens]